MDKNEKPCWTVCYLICALMIGLLGLTYWIPVSDGVHKIVACGIVLGGYGLIVVWLRASRAALAGDDWDQPSDRPPARPRDVPLSPVQAHYLRVMERYKQH